MSLDFFDCIVIGSGFGGAAAALRLTERGLKVCLLERGRSYRPGEFPRSPTDLSQSFWDPERGTTGLFHLFSAPKLGVVAASGLGGGSLVYANVLLRKPRDTFFEVGPKGLGSKPWPVSYDDLEAHYTRVERLIGVNPFPVTSPAGRSNARVAAMQRAAQHTKMTWHPAPLAVEFDATKLDGHREPCNFCSECLMGCNRGSKNTLDLTLIARAQALGLEVRTLAEVRVIRRNGNDGYLVSYLDHTPQSSAGGKRLLTRSVCSPRVVLAAGTLNSTYLLLHSRPHLGPIGPALGTRFNGNGDVLAFGWGSTVDLEPHRGTVITSVLTADRYTIQDGGIPNYLAWWLDGLNAAGFIPRFFKLQSQRRIASALGTYRSNIGSSAGALFASPQALSRQLALVSAGFEPATGVLHLNRRGKLDLKWDASSAKHYYSDLRNRLKEAHGAWNGRSLDLHTLLPGRISTVHPLGGCPMGTDPKTSVVSPLGEVHGNPGLYVADGSIFPSSVGVNPALTIGAVADRIADRMAV